jgi:hypothetical protein
VVPTSWALDLMRHAILDSTPLAPLPVEITALVATSVSRPDVGPQHGLPTCLSGR